VIFTGIVYDVEKAELQALLPEGYEVDPEKQPTIVFEVMALRNLPWLNGRGELAIVAYGYGSVFDLTRGFASQATTLWEYMPTILSVTVLLTDLSGDPTCLSCSKASPIPSLQVARNLASGELISAYVDVVLQYAQRSYALVNSGQKYPTGKSKMAHAFIPW
jgi:hypothetical protein